MTQPEVYLFSIGKKDTYCLEPVVEPLRAKFDSVTEVAFEDLDEAMARFSTDECPVGVFTSFNAYELACFIRGGRPFLSIGLEHGIAPFKGYTYTDQFLRYDCYVSPTRMWADRMARRHPRYASKFTNVAYPRIDDLQARVAATRALDHEAWGGAAPEARDLVVLSWGVDYGALNRLPDRPGIVYLMHPSVFRSLSQSRFVHAKVLLSDPETASALIAGAARVFGDFSSMTLEAACLHPKTYMFVERRLYGLDCDLQPSFFDRQSAAFGEVPHANYRLPKEEILDFEGLAAALSGGELRESQPVSAWAPQAMMPDLQGKNVEVAAAVISDVVAQLWSAKRALSVGTTNLVALQTVYSAYRDVLGREPDFPAALDHAKAWLNNPAAMPTKTLQLYHGFAQSVEGTKRWHSGTFDVPKVVIPPVGRPA